MSNRISIRGTAVALGATVAVAAGAVGLNIAGALGDLTPSEAVVATHSATPVAAFTREAAVSRADAAHGKQLAKKAVEKRKAHAARKAAAKRARAAKAAKAAKASRLARQRVSRSTVRTYSGDPRAIARSMAASRYGWGAAQFSCLNSLWQKESGWNYRAANGSGAYGIPQALPGSKMSSKGSDWRTNPATQIAWGLSYIKSSYGSPCSAWQKSRSSGWY
ncbi:MAG: aggregation-promoting factor C-terminal-like domain-containing protein [Actinomycetes bacterium]